MTRFGGELVLLQSEWGRAIDPAQVEATLKDHPKVKLVAFVHAETSTSVASDAKAICGIAQRRVPDDRRLCDVPSRNRRCPG